MRHGWTAVAAAAVLALLPACGDDDDAEDDDTEIGNPASAYCEEQGGVVELERDEDGNERGICVLPDGTRVDEWEHYRARERND